MTRAMLLALACASTLAACDAAPSAPQPALAGAPSLDRINVNQRFPFALTVANPCPPAEPVGVEGFLHVSQHGEESETGTTTRTHLVLHGSGTGAVTGAHYVLAQTGRQEATLTTTPFGITTESDSRFALIRAGEADNVFVTARLRVVCDENGCRAEVDETETECRG